MWLLLSLDVVPRSNINTYAPEPVGRGPTVSEVVRPVSVITDTVASNEVFLGAYLGVVLT